jgi:hypothetical protein
MTAFAGLASTLTAVAARTARLEKPPPALPVDEAFDQVRYWAGVIGAFALVYGGLAAMVAVATYIAG